MCSDAHQGSPDRQPCVCTTAVACDLRSCDQRRIRKEYAAYVVLPRFLVHAAPLTETLDLRQSAQEDPAPAAAAWSAAWSVCVECLMIACCPHPSVEQKIRKNSKIRAENVRAFFILPSSRPHMYTTLVARFCAVHRSELWLYWVLSHTIRHDEVSPDPHQKTSLEEHGTDYLKLHVSFAVQGSRSRSHDLCGLFVDIL